MSGAQHPGETLGSSDPTTQFAPQLVDSNGSQPADAPVNGSARSDNGSAPENLDETRPRASFGVPGAGPAGGFEPHPFAPPGPPVPPVPPADDGFGATTTSFGDATLAVGRGAPPPDFSGPPPAPMPPVDLPAPDPLAGPPTDLAGAPTEFSGPPPDLSGAPTEFTVARSDLAAAPTDFAAAPTDFAGPRPDFGPPAGAGPVSPPGLGDRPYGYDLPAGPPGAPYPGPVGPGGLPDAGRPAPGPRPGPSRAPRARGPRRAKLQLRHINPWTVLKFSCVLSVALFFVWLITIGLLYGILQGAGVIDHINNAVTTINGNGSKNPVTPGLVFGGAAIIGVINIVLFIALSTVGSVVYNLCADLVGGIEVTLSERE